jgi:hypothetical protein
MVDASDPQAAGVRPRALLAIAKGAFLFLSSGIVGLLWSALALVCVSLVNHWDDALGTGFTVIGVLLLGVLAGFAGGAISAAMAWNGRHGGAQRLQAQAVIRAAHLAIPSEALLVGSLLSVTTGTARAPRAGWGLALTLSAAAVLLLWKAARIMASARPPA